MIFVLIAALYAHTQSMPPLVVVESSSMVHDDEGEVGSIDAGDLVLVHKSSFENIVTFAEASDPSNPYYGHETHGMEGDVVIYKKNGETSTPIIHRAILRVVPNEAYPATTTANPCPTGGTYDPEWRIDGRSGACVLTWDVPGTQVINQTQITIDFDGIDAGYYDCKRFVHAGVEPHLRIHEWTPKHSGLLTLGDANKCSVDQGPDAVNGSSGLRSSDGSVLGPVQEGWLVGRAGGEIPWLGAVKLMVSGSGPGLTYVPGSSIMYLLACIGGILLFPMVAEPVLKKIFSTSPESIQAEQERAFLVALGVDEEE
tara:strand:+ start:856 stop:1794 length:939 start_codon:yes stop_codon:yes gene_type:complete